MTNKRLAIAALLTLTFGAIGYAALWAPAAYFASALRAQHVDASVSLEGIRYEVKSGTIEGPALSVLQRARVLELAYSEAFARRAPLLGIAGVDPGSLARAAEKLAAVQSALADAQQTPQEAAAVGALYPIDFLRALAKAEAARQRFITTGEEHDERSYRAALKVAVQQLSGDAAAFRSSFDRLISPKKSFRFPGLGGSITKQTLLDSVAQLQVRSGEALAAYRARERCLSGFVPSCDADLALMLPALVPAGGEEAYQKELLHLFADSNLGPVGGGRTLLSLASSTCLSLHPPYTFVLFEQGAIRMPLWYSGELFFSPTKDSTGAVAQYLYSRGVSYSYINPLEFYICPDVGSDLGAAIATKEALTSSSTPESQSELWRERSAGLDTLVELIATVDSADLEQHKAGVATSIDAASLFLTHSAFPSLYLTQNPGAGHTPLRLRENNQEDYQTFLDHVQSYSQLITTVPRATMVHNIHEYLLFEEGR